MEDYFAISSRLRLLIDQREMSREELEHEILLIADECLEKYENYILELLASDDIQKS